MKRITLPAALCLAALLLTSCAGDGRPEDTTHVTTTAPADTTPGVITTPDTTADTTTPTTSAPTTSAPTTDSPAAPGLHAAASFRLEGLPCNRAVQQFAFLRDDAGLWIFTVQRVDDTIYLSRLSVGSDGKTATLADYTTLDGYGHGESFDIAVVDGAAYLYIASGASSLTSYAWATTITRLRYESGSVSDVRVLRGLECATDSGQPLHSDATPYRVNFALDTEADVMSIYVRADAGGKGKNIRSYLTAYRFSALHAMLDAAESVSLADASSAFLATTGARAVEDICYNGSFQGMEVCPDGTVVIIGGTLKARPQLSRFTLDGGTVKRTRVLNFNGIESELLRNRNWTKATSFLEIESACCFEGAIYCSFNPADADVRPQNGTEIFIITED